MGLLLLSGFGLMLIASLPHPFRHREWHYAPIAWTGAACVTVLILLLLDHLPGGLGT
jgi:hypothetical protein